jgi:hypothetical protein
MLAKELYESSVDVNLHLSVYDLASLHQQFDIILFLGVYYHLFDPFYALAQIRHCCHKDTIVVMQGPVAVGLPPATALFQFTNHAYEWMPTIEAFEQFLRAAYFSIISTNIIDPPEPLTRVGKRWRLRMGMAILKNSYPDVQALIRQLEPPPTLLRMLLLQCAPFEGVNELYPYRPAFGLHRYDSRFRDT